MARVSHQNNRGFRAYSDNQSSHIAEAVRTELSRNILLTAKPICGILGLDYGYHGDYVAHIISRYRSDYKGSLGLRCPKFHAWHGWIYAAKEWNVEDAVMNGWVRTRARNHYLLWKDEKLGRLEWHYRTGRMKVWIGAPANQGKALQLLANAVMKTCLINDFGCFEKWASGLRFKGASVVVETGQKLPYLRVDLLKESNGVSIVLGDRSHPRSRARWFERFVFIIRSPSSVLAELAAFSRQSTRDPSKS